MTTGNRARRDPAEGRGASRVENRWPDTWEGALDPTNLSTNRQRIANLARTKRGAALYSLHHVIDLDWMKEAYRLTRKDGAPGIDGVTAADYEVNLEANLLDLLDRIKSGRYRAPPVRRAYIPKADDSRDLIGEPAQASTITANAVVGEVAPHHRGQMAMLVAGGPMSGTTGCWNNLYLNEVDRMLERAREGADQWRNAVAAA